MRNSSSHLASYHKGELAAQDRAGFREHADHLRPIISDRLPRGARDFLADLRFLVVGATAPDGQVWASMVYGQPGFLQALGPREVLIGARPLDVDPLAAVLAAPALVGTLAIDLKNRRRLRINGRTVPATGDSGFQWTRHTAIAPNTSRAANRRRQHLRPRSPRYRRAANCSRSSAA